MKMKMYWPQRKVFLLGILALFPEILEKHYIAMGYEINKYLFRNKDEELFEDELRQYQEEGYFKFEIEYDAPLKISPKGSVTTAPIAYFISQIDSRKATDDLTTYLESWRLDETSSGTTTKPSDYPHQRAAFIKALTLAYPYNKNPIIRWSDLYQEVHDYHDLTLPPFWELILSYQLVDGQLAITNIGYSKVVSKKNHKSYIQPFAELKLTDGGKLKRKVDLLSKSSEPISDDDPKELPYKGLLAGRDGLIRFNDEVINLTHQQREVMRVFLKRPEELRTRDDFIHGDIFPYKDYKDLDATLSKLVSATHRQMRLAVGYDCISNMPSIGWMLKLR
jgi:hypothetical protein